MTYIFETFKAVSKANLTIHIAIFIQVQFIFMAKLTMKRSIAWKKNWICMHSILTFYLWDRTRRQRRRANFNSYCSYLRRYRRKFKPTQFRIHTFPVRGRLDCLSRLRGADLRPEGVHRLPHHHPAPLTWCRCRARVGPRPIKIHDEQI